MNVLNVNTEMLQSWNGLENYIIRNCIIIILTHSTKKKMWQCIGYINPDKFTSSSAPTNRLSSWMLCHVTIGATLKGDSEMFHFE